MNGNKKNTIFPFIVIASKAAAAAVVYKNWLTNKIMDAMSVRCACENHRKFLYLNSTFIHNYDRKFLAKYTSAHSTFIFLYMLD